MKTRIHCYSFDVSIPEQKAEYAKLRETLKDYPHRMHAIGDYYYPQIDGKEIELETEHLFDNQWNSAPIEGFSDKGYRLFDWASEACLPNKNIKRGHYLEQTDEMREIRRNTVVCGYCGRQEPAAKGYVFCPHCLDSQYLTTDRLYMTRMRPVDDIRKQRAPLTDAELAYLLPLYKEAQLHGTTERGKQRLAKLRQDIEATHEKDSRNAEAEYRGKLWLLERMPGILDNVIYYNHTQKFSFGWRQPIDEAIKSELLDLISEFPYPYEIKCADGKTLTAA